MIALRRTYLRDRKELTDDELREHAPSIFASQAIDGVSDRYVFLPTSEVIQGMREAGWAPVEAKQQSVRLENRRGFQKHLIRFQRRNLMARPGECTAEVCLVNSHDRSSAYELHAGLFRFICGNGMVVSDTTFESIRLRHTGFSTNEVIQASFQVLDALPQILKRLDTFRTRLLSEAECMVFAREALHLRYVEPENTPIGPDVLLQPRRKEDAGEDLWHTFSRVQENLLRGGQRDLSRRQKNGRHFPKTRSIMGLDSNVRLNRGLWDLAERIHEKGIQLSA